MAERVKSFFGGRTREQKWAQIDARKAQAVAERETVEETQRLNAERNASGRLLRGAGRRMLTFQGASQLSPTMGG